MKVILAEKPSVARDLARHVRATSRRDGYFEGSGYQVTWAFGHLVKLCDFEDYDPALKRWSLDTIPFVPAEFQLKVNSDDRSRQQFAVVKRLFANADELICATDAGREGELIFRNLQTLTGCVSKPFRRLWLSSLTPEAIHDAFAALRSGREYDSLFAAARCRSQADWIVGLNASRLYTILFGHGTQLWTVGRVQTPVLALIVRRDDDIRTFQVESFWELKTVYRGATFAYDGDRFRTLAEAEAARQRIVDAPLRIIDIAEKKDVLKPPLLHDLTDLQREMNRRYGFSAATTLEIAQQLYEDKLITYPRTDSRFLSNDMKKPVTEALRSLASYMPDAIAKLPLARLPFTSRIINDQKVTDHHAIIPTGKTPRFGDERAKEVYDAILTRLIAAFYPPCLRSVTTVSAVANELPFKAKGTVITQIGWKELYPESKQRPKPRGTEETVPVDTKESDDGGPPEDASDVEQTLPVFRIGESGAHQPIIKEGETKPPPHYTEATLLAMMETAGKLVEDEELRDALRQRGIGTPATRASIIEILLTRHYIDRQKKSLIATDAGRYLISLIHNAVLKSAELTGEWELQLRKIEASELAPAAFMEKTTAFIGSIHAEVLQAPIDTAQIGACPRCSRPVIQGKKGFGCSGWRDGCWYVLWMAIHGHQISLHEARELFQRGCLAHPVTLQLDGRMVQAHLYLTDKGQPLTIPLPLATFTKEKGGPAKRSPAVASTSGDSAALGPCPLCGQPVREFKNRFACAGGAGGCAFVIWRSMAGKTISKATARTLLAKGASSRLKGFKSRSGNSFDARLVIRNGKVEFEFAGA